MNKFILFWSSLVGSLAALSHSTEVHSQSQPGHHSEVGKITGELNHHRQGGNPIIIQGIKDTKVVEGTKKVIRETKGTKGTRRRYPGLYPDVMPGAEPRSYPDPFPEFSYPYYTEFPQQSPFPIYYPDPSPIPYPIYYPNPNPNPWPIPQYPKPTPHYPKPTPQYPKPDPQYPKPNPQKPQPNPQNPNFDINHMLRLVNEARAKVGSPPLSLHPTLTSLSQAHSQDQFDHQSMSHTGSDGSSPFQRTERAGYTGASGENVAYNQRTVEQVMESWIQSPGHYQNIINPEFKDFGAGMVGYYWTQNFGAAY